MPGHSRTRSSHFPRCGCRVAAHCPRSGTARQAPRAAGGGRRAGPPLVREASLPRIERVCSYVAHEDTDALVRHQAHDCVAEAQQLQAAWLQVAGGS